MDCGGGGVGNSTEAENNDYLGQAEEEEEMAACSRIISVTSGWVAGCLLTWGVVVTRTSRRRGDNSFQFRTNSCMEKFQLANEIIIISPCLVIMRSLGWMDIQN